MYVLGYPARGFLRYGGCEVVKEPYDNAVGRRTFGIGCDAQSGYAGAPVLSAETHRVVGVFWGGQQGFVIIRQPTSELHEFVAPLWELSPQPPLGAVDFGRWPPEVKFR